MDLNTPLNPVEQRLVAKADIAKIPISAAFELTPVCNLDCDMCFIHTAKHQVDKQGGLLSADDWINYAIQLKECGTLFILLTGGEPLLYPDFKIIYLALRDLGFVITINTNGLLFDDSIFELFSQYKPRRVNLTLYGTSNATYKNLCKTSTGYTTCMQVLTRLQEARIDTKLNVSLVQKNRHEQKQFYQIAQALSFPIEVNSYMFPCTRTTCGKERNIPVHRLSADEAASAELTYYQYEKGGQFNAFQEKMHQQLVASEPNTSGKGLDCRAGSSSCWINWKGEMTPCVAMEKPAISLKESSIRDAWNYIVTSCYALPKHDECAHCKLRPVCNICYAAGEHEKSVSGNLSYLCQMAEHKRTAIMNNSYEKDQTICSPPDRG